MAQLKSFKYLETLERLQLSHFSNDSESTTSGGDRRSSNVKSTGQERQEADESEPMAVGARGLIQSGKSPRSHSADNASSNSQRGNRPKSETSKIGRTSSEQFQQANSKPIEPSSSVNSEPSASSSSASSSLISTVRGGTSTALGAALTTDNSSQSSEISDTRSAWRRDSDQLSSNEEYQSARVDWEDDDDDCEEQNYGRSMIDDQGNKENHRNQQQHAIDEEARSKVTKMKIEYPNRCRSKQNFGAHPDQQFGSGGGDGEPARTQLSPRRRINHMARSQKSLSLAPQGVGGTGVAIPIVSSPLSLKLPGSATGSENMSQSSKTLNPNLTGNQFVIRWHNVKLYVRPKRRLPKFISDSFVYKALCSSRDGSNGPDEMMQFDAAPFNSTPVEYKIPPAIHEGLEMKALPSTRDRSVLSSPIVDRSANKSTVPGRSSSGTRCVLDSVSGEVFSGQMTAILGPSGVGKTSLLNSLTGRNTLDGTGRVSLIGASNCKRMSVVTVPQIDVLPNKLTALEDLQFTSRLKNPGRRFDHGRNIARVVEHLHMNKFLNTQIDKLSGGEARRLSIARKLLNSPDILILDEPTSGLDANTCKKIIIALRDIVEHSDNLLDKPMSIIITIHQPQQEVYNLFHRVYVMAVGGHAIYEGPPKELLPTLLECSSLSRLCRVDQLNENPAIVAIEVASGDYGLDIINELAMYHENKVYGEFLGGTSAGIGLKSPVTTPRILRKPCKSPLGVAKFEMSQLMKSQESFDDLIGGGAQSLDCMFSVTSISYAPLYDADLPEPVSKLEIDKRLRRSAVMKSNFWSHTGTLIERSWLLTKRDRLLMFIRILGFLLVAMGTIQIFSDTLDPAENLCPKFESEVDNIYAYVGKLGTRLNGMMAILRQASAIRSFFWQVLLCLMMVTSALTGLMFPTQMQMFMREYKNGWYSPASFIMSQTIAELPVDLIGPLLTLVITYPLCNQPDSLYYWCEICYAIVFVVSCIICKSQAQIIGVFLMDSVENSVFMACIAVAPAVLFSGIPVRINQMAMPLQWVSYSSFLRYAFESLVSLRYGYGLCPCDDEVINGYPITASTSAIPPHLETLARGLFELYRPDSGSLPLVNETTTIASADLATLSSAVSAQSIGDHDNLFLQFIRLLTDASNIFVSSTELSSCSSYRSLYLIDMGVKSNAFTDWIVVMLVLFVFSRILTYFAVKTVIKLRRS